MSEGPSSGKATMPFGRHWIRAWEAIEGSLFRDEQECLKHDLRVLHLRKCTSHWIARRQLGSTEPGVTYLFEVYRDPGNCEDNLLPLLVEDYCQRCFGRKVAFRDGLDNGFEAWNLHSISKEDFDHLSLDPKIQRTHLFMGEIEIVLSDSSGRSLRQKTRGLKPVNP